MASFSGAYEKSVKGATKSKLAAPKSKYIEHLLSATREGDGAIGEVFRGIQDRLRDSTWTVVFKAQIVTHSMIRDGYKNSVIDYLANSYSFKVSALVLTGCSSVSKQGKNIQSYGEYLRARVNSFKKHKVDFVKAKNDATGQGRLRALAVDNHLLSETESVQKLITALLGCRFFEQDLDNEVAVTAFRLLVADLLVLFQVANEGVINVLEHYFEMKKYDAERGLTVYKTFVEQTDGVIVYMSLARSLENVTRLTIPNLQHAPTSLGENLEEYLRDPDFEKNRIEFLAAKNNKSKDASSTQANASRSSNAGGASTSQAQLKSALKQGDNPNESNPFGPPRLPNAVQNGANNDLIDFFGSLGASQPQQQQPQFVPQGLPQMQMQNMAQGMPSQMTGNFVQPQQQQAFMQQQATGFNPYLQQQQQAQMQMQMPQQQMNQMTSQAQPMQTGSNGYGNFMSPPQNEFAMLSQPSQAQQGLQPLQMQSTGSNPFRKSMLPATMTGSLSSPYTVNPYQQPATLTGHLTSQRTGANPFARPVSQPQPPPSSGMYGPVAAMPLQQQSTGNPFAKSNSSTFAYAQPPQQQQLQQPTIMAPQQTGSNPFRKSMMPMQGQQQQMNYGGR